MMTVFSSPPFFAATVSASPNSWNTCGRTASCSFSRLSVIGEIDWFIASATVCRFVMCRWTSWMASDAATPHAPSATAAPDHTATTSMIASPSRCQSGHRA